MTSSSSHALASVLASAAEPAAVIPQPVRGLLVGRADDPAEARADARADRAGPWPH